MRRFGRRDYILNTVPTVLFGDYIDVMPLVQFVHFKNEMTFSWQTGVNLFMLKCHFLTRPVRR